MINDYLQELYKLYTEPPFLDYVKLAQYVSEKYNIKISASSLRYRILKVFPNIRNEIKNTNNERFLYKGGRVSAEERKNVIELLAKGKTQTEVANLTNIDKSSINIIFKRSKLEAKDIKKARILNKINDINFDNMEKWWNEYRCINTIKNKYFEIGCNITDVEIKYILKEILHLKRHCKICRKEIDMYNSGIFCGEECQRQAKLDYAKNHQNNRRVKGKGKTTQSVSRSEKIREAKEICYLCGEKLDTTIRDVYHPLYIVLDHVEALTYSNNGSKENLKAVCRCCNTFKKDKHKDYYSMEQYKYNRKTKIESYIPKNIGKEPIDKEQFILDCKNGMTIKELCIKHNRSNFIVWKYKQNLGLLKSKKHLN